MSIFNGTADDIFNKKTDYPVGSVCMFNTNIDPNEMYGGTWVRIKGKFIFGADDDTYPLGSEGGEAKHTLSIEEMPSHNHTITFLESGAGGIAPDGLTVQRGYYDNGVNLAQIPRNFEISNNGGNMPHNNMPPYVAFYIWAKVA